MNDMDVEDFGKLLVLRLARTPDTDELSRIRRSAMQDLIALCNVILGD